MSIDLYDLYSKAVQSPDSDVEFLLNVYKELKKKSPVTLREDFCAAGLLCTEWVKSSRNRQAYGIDLDLEPLNYGRSNYIEKLSSHQKTRIQLIQKNVLSKTLPKVDISIAMNFSYFLFKKRELLKAYLKNVRNSLNPHGIAVFDVFGGSQCYDQIVDRTRHKGFTYYWDQTGFDPVTNEAIFHIHFRVGRHFIKKAFTYDWRLWTIPEMRELLHEVGFKKVHVYWEGSNRKGEGNDIFTRSEKGEACLSWIAYIVAEKN
jgi:hypothetical protein